MAAHPGSPRHRATARLLGLTQLGHAHWFFGNLYEAIVGVPDLLATNRSRRRSDRSASPLAPGSPVRYYVAAAPVTFPAACIAAALGWDERRNRPWLVAAAACSIAGVTSTIYLVRAVNLRLFFSAEPLDAGERGRLLRSWYRVNVARIVLTGATSVAAHKARSDLSR